MAKGAKEGMASSDELISGCGQIYLTQIDYRLSLVESIRATLHVKSKTLTMSYMSVPPPSFYNKDWSALKKCVTKVQVIDSDLVPGEHVVKQSLYGCTNASSSNDLRFDDLFVHGHLRVCVYHVLTYSQEIDTTKSCERVQETTLDPVVNPVATPHNSEKESLLPLVLTLVFLCVGIVALTVLYLIFKGCLRDRRDYRLSNNPFYGDNNNSHYGSTTCGGFAHNLQRTLWFICPLSIFKGRSRRHHGPYSDELFLDDDDNCTEMSQVGSS